MISRQMSDMLNLSREGDGGILDCGALGYRLSVQQQCRSGLITDCAFVQGSVALRKYGNAMLRHDSAGGVRLREDKRYPLCKMYS
jgi:hypothetical protein